MSASHIRHAWLNPASGERITVRFDGVTTRIHRRGEVSEIANPPWNEAEAIAAARESLRSFFQWEPFNVDSWRRTLFGIHGNDGEATKRAFLDTGLPAKLWDDIDSFQRLLGFVPASGPNEPMVHPTGNFNVHYVLTGQPVPPVQDGTIVIRQDDPALDDSLLFHPTPEIKSIFEQLYLKQRISVSPPPADQSFHVEFKPIEAGWLATLDHL